MPRRSIWKGSFVDAFLLRMKKKRDHLLNRKIWSRVDLQFCRNSLIDSSVRIYNGKTYVRCKITEGRVGHKFLESLLRHRNEDFREQILDWEKKGDKVKSKRIWHEKEIRFR